MAATARMAEFAVWAWVRLVAAVERSLEVRAACCELSERVSCER